MATDPKGRFMKMMRVVRASLALLALSGSLSGAVGAPSLQIRADQDVQVKVAALSWSLDGPFARRSVELVLRNPHARNLEAEVILPLADNERLQGYALDVEGRMRDAVPIGQQQARTVFEETVRKQVDPALARQDVGNAYRIRVFPVPSGGERRLRIDVASLAERNRCGWNHRLSMPLPGRQPVTASARSTSSPQPGNASPVWRNTSGEYLAEWQMRPEAAPRKVCLPAPAGDTAYSVRADDDLQMDWLELAPGHDTQLPPRALPATLDLVWDASYSMTGQDRSAELRLLQRLLENRKSTVYLTVLRETAEKKAWHITGNDDVDRLLAHLNSQIADGATNFGAWQPVPDADAAAIFSDLLPTLPQASLPMPTRPTHVIVNGLRHPALARWFTRSGGQVVDLSVLLGDEALRALRRQPAMQAVPGPLDRGWHLGSQGGDKHVRACHVAPSPSAIPALPVQHGDAPTLRRHMAIGKQSSAHAAFWCAAWWVDSLERQPDRHRSQLTMIGERFGIANSETSLLVLESDDDYVRHGILPPAADVALRDRVLRQRQQAALGKAAALAQHRERIEKGWGQRVAWWQKDFPKDAPPPVPETHFSQGHPYPAPRAMAAAPAPAAAMRVTSSPAAESAPAPVVEMRLQAVPVAAPYANRLGSAQNAQALHADYVDLRQQYGQSPAFHFDVAQRFFELGDTASGWRVLSNTVELLPRNHAGLRLVAYRLSDAGLHAEAEILLREVLRQAPDEPQSLRDLAMALPSPKSCQESLDLLAAVVDTPWHSRFADIGLIALAEYNDLLVRCPESRPRAWSSAMLQPLPVGLRAVLRWDLNDTDIDLHVTDPNGETAFYGKRLTYQGGAMSRDFTGGYGPEEFVLRNPKPGAYTVHVNYYGSRLSRLSRGVVINLVLQSGFGTPHMRQETVSMRLLEKSGKVLVGGFTVSADGTLHVGQTEN